MIEAEVTDDKVMANVVLQFKQSKEMDYEAIFFEKVPAWDHVYIAKIPKEVIWSDEITYFIEATDGVHKSKTNEYVIDIQHKKRDYQAIPELLITEIMPNTSNTGALDGFEFIEIYNNSDRDIPLKDYKLHYRYPMEGKEADLIWGPEKEDVTVKSGETYVFWIINRENDRLEVSDFNNHYGVSLKENRNISKVYSSGMENSSERTLSISTNTGKDISFGSYNEDVNRVDSAIGKSILYRFPANGTKELLKISSGKLQGSPGSVWSAQVPKVKVVGNRDKERPVIQNETTVQSIKPTENLEVKADIQDNFLVKTVRFYYRTEDNKPFNQIYLHENYDDKMYHHIIYSPELIGKEQVEYYFEASDGKNRTQSEKKTVQIEQKELMQGLRLNVEKDEVLNRTKTIKVSSSESSEQMQLSIDGEKKLNTFPALESEAYFAFDVRKTNLYFKNGVTMGNEELKIFDDTYDKYTTITVPVSADKLKAGNNNVISIRSGSKVSPFDDNSEENRDNFYVKNVRLVLSDGTIIHDKEYSDPGKELEVGEGGASKPVYDFSFTIPEEKFSSLGFVWETRNVEEGKHVIEAKDSEKTIQTEVVVDNTAPAIKPTVEEGKEYKGEFTIDAAVTDRWSNITNIKATLNNIPISLPYQTSSADLEAGNQQLKITAADEVGNKRDLKQTFKVAAEQPLSPEPLKTKFDDTTAQLSVEVADPTDDHLDVSFYKAYHYTAANRDTVKVKKSASDIEPPKTFYRKNERELSEDEYEKLKENDNQTIETSSTTQFPYHRFDVEVNPSIDENDVVELVWKGSSIPDRKVTMYAWNYSNEKWIPINAAIAGEKKFTLKGHVTVPEYVKGNKVSVIVQDEVTQVLDYDYSFIWMSDTQYYSERYPHIYRKQVQWIEEMKEELNIKYVFHTGDLVDDADQVYQWKVAHQNMKVLGDSHIPYGVLAGNHDVGHKDGSYNQFSKYFGERHFADKSYYGESYKNNRGHFDLISAEGNDYIMIYMGWGVTDEDLDWVNKVLSDHPNHKAILSFHEYLLVSGNRSPFGNKIYEKVVIPNENVAAVLCGHYHDSELLADEIDDDGDGKSDRVVYQILADYQGGPEGGQGYIRLLHVNPENNVIYIKTYSPYLNDYNFYDPKKYPSKDEFTMELDLEPKEKKVETDHFEVNVYTDALIEQVSNVKSGEVATALWDRLKPEQTYYWYTIAQDKFRGQHRSAIWEFTTRAGENTRRNSKNGS
ncbi:metallophosphoesterase [Bacillus sp. IB182487]|uniref:Metallophosphoesterase n=1 Tax=Metabacillus arenae TaxID=2771434 RepID=A0A926NJ17_9BACI|nr:metallophosphoesterase [Metabacillus arenae]